MAQHQLDDSAVHYVWDNRFAPRLRVQPGDAVTFSCRDAADHHFGPDSTLPDLLRRGPSKGHPLTGPVFVEGAEPGDALVVEILDLQHKGWGWTSCRPTGGLLPPEDGMQPALKIWRLEPGAEWAEFKPGIRVALTHFAGIMGVAPAEPGQHLTMPPRPAGGNMDVRHLTRGTKLFLPVFVPGALFSTGDCHAAQGDGEVCITGIEAPMDVTVRFGVKKGAHLPAPQFITAPGPLVPPAQEAKGYYATMGIQPDLYEAARDSVRHMIAWLVAEHNLTREEAYLLCSVCVDLKVSEVVDAPNWIVTAYLPLAIFQ